MPPLPIDLLDASGLLLYFHTLREAGYTWHLDDDPAEIYRGVHGEPPVRSFTDEQAEILRRFVKALNTLCEPLCSAEEAHTIHSGAWSIADIVDWNANDKATEKLPEEFWTSEYFFNHDPEKEREHGPDDTLTRLHFGRFTLCLTIGESEEFECDRDCIPMTSDTFEDEAEFLTCLGWLLANADLRHPSRFHSEQEPDVAAANALVAERNQLKKQVQSLSAAVRNLLNCPELNLDEMDNYTVEAIDRVTTALSQCAAMPPAGSSI